MSVKLSVREKAAFLRDVVLGANDGLVTTFAVVTGATGASLSSSVIIILGIAKLFADAVSMASGNYLGVKSEIEYEEVKDAEHSFKHSPVPHGMTTFFAFILIGFLPLIPYVFRLSPSFIISAAIVAFSLFTIGSFRSSISERKWYVGGAEMLLVGGLAAFIAYIVGYLLGEYVV